MPDLPPSVIDYIMKAQNLNMPVTGFKPYPGFSYDQQYTKFNPIGGLMGTTPQAIEQALMRGGLRAPGQLGAMRMNANENVSLLPNEQQDLLYQAALQQQKEQKAIKDLMSIVPKTLEEHGIGASMFPQSTGGGSIKRPFETDNE